MKRSEQLLNSGTQELQEMDFATTETIAEAQSDKVADRNLAALLHLFHERARIWRGTLGGLLVGLVVALLLPPEYTSTTRLMPPDQPGSQSAILSLLTGAGNDAGILTGDLFGVKRSSSLFIGILRSRTVQDRIINEFDLRSVYWVSSWESARATLEENTSITEDRKSGIITVTVRDRSPERAADIARAYLVELDRLVVELSTSAARRQRVFLEGRLEAVKQDLDRTAKNFSEFASRNVAINIPEQGKAIVAAAATLQGQLIAAQSELSGLEQIYTPNNVRVRAVRARIAELKRQLERMGGTDAGSNASGVDASLYPSMRKLPLLGVKYADLFRETKLQEVLFETLTKQYELAKVEEAKEIPSVRVLDAASIPEKRSGPPRLLITGSGALAGFLLSAIWILGYRRWELVDSREPRKAFVGFIAGALHEDLENLLVRGRAALSQSRFLRRFHKDSSNPGA